MPFAPGNTLGRGRPKSGKSFTDMLRLAVAERRAAEGTTRLRAIADALVAKAEAGDVHAIKEIADRLDGRTKAVVENQVDLKTQPIIIQLTKDDLATI